MSVLNKVNVISSIGYDCKICQKLSHERQESIAGVFSTYAHSWLTCGPDLFVLNNSDGVLQSYWTFGENLQDDLEITCAVELPLDGCAIPLLILGISSENVNLICFFNPNTRKILRTIDIIYPVRTICVIEDGTNEVYPLNDTLTPSEGLIAVGCAEGTVLLIDLCRSILCKAVNGDFRYYSTEENPSEVVYVGINSVTSGGLSQKIVESRKKKNCASVILTDPSDEGITALLYSIESAVLFIGNSSGSFHMWNMSSLSCLFKSPGTNRAIISLSLLEPCDDPRHNLYLWICFEEYAQVAMYCISFSSKFFVHGYGVYYQNFESAGLVYRFTLGMEVDVLAKRPICSQAVAKLVPKNLVRCISLPEAEGTHLRLFITAYEIIDKGQISIRAVIFDLNQWYRDQMPEEGISACLDSIDLDSKSLWHLQIDPSSLTLYQCVRPQEQHFYPTAFDFQVWCIEEEGVRCLEKLGLQTQWLRNMSRMGSKALIEPTQIFLGALAAGLLPSFIDPPDPEANNEVEERSYVLTVCLENRIIMVIEDCVKDWNSGGYTVKGCTIQFLLHWLWSLHRTYKANGNKICIPLFDQSGMKFDVSEKRSLQHCKSLLNTVQSVYTNIVNRYKNTIIINGVEEKLTAMSLVRLYFDCCLKLISVNLLPEPNDLGRPSDSVVYHFDNINTYAINRRKEAPFLGDSLLGRTDAEKQWLEEGGTGLYPPPSIQSVLRFCLHPSPSFANKMSLLLYLFMDIVNSYSPIRSQSVLDRIKNFQHLMRIPEVQYKIVAGCWYFDHSMFDEGVDLLFDPRVLCVDLSENQHRGILHLLASEGKEKLALQYLRLKSPTLNLADDLRMELNLLLSNGLVNEAFLFQRKHPEMRETLLIEFFEGCIERKQLGQVFGLNLDFKEEATLMKYLKSSGLKEKGDLQVLLLLSKAKYTEAMFLNDKLNSSINGPKSRIETDTRDMIVRGITGSLNTISRHIANEMKSYRPPPAGSHPRPLSSLIKVRNGPDGPLFQTDSKVLLSTVAKSTRHLSDFVNSFESGRRRKREEKDTDFGFENEPSRKRLKLWDTASDINKVPSLSGKWLTSPIKPSASQNRDVMELVGTPLVKKRGKRFSPQSRPSSILKGKTPEKSIITEDFGETPKKTIRFALPENEIQVTPRKPLRENETTAPNKYSKITIHSEDESAILVTEEFSKPRGLGKLSARKPLHGNDSLNNSVAGLDSSSVIENIKKLSARKPLHGNDSLNNSVAGLDSSSVIENIKDRLRSSAKKKVLEDGVNWHEVAEVSKPRVLFTQGVSKITSVTKSDKTPSSTPMSQVLLDITVTSAEKKYLDSPSRGEETSPVTENLFNTTLLPKVLFSSVNNEKEKLPEEASMHLAFLERYKQLRNKNIKSSNAVITPEKEKERGASFEESFNVICTKKTVELFKNSNTSSSTKIVIDEDIPSKKESIFIENVLKESNDEFDKQLEQHKNKSEVPADKVEFNNESLLEEQEVDSNEVEKQFEAETEHISVNDELYHDIENSLHENNPLLKDDISPCKDEDEYEIAPEDKKKVTEWPSLKSIGVEGNCSFEEAIDNYHDVCEYQNMKETQMCCDVIVDDKTFLNKSMSIEVLSSKKSNSENKKDKNELLNDNEMLKKELEIPGDSQCNDTKTSAKDKSKEVSSNSKKDCEEIINIASDDEDDNEDKQSYDESLTDEETEGMSGEFSEEIEEEMSEKEENGSDNEGSLPDVSSISSDGDTVENLDESKSVNSHRRKSPEKEIKKKENVDSKKGQTGETPIVVLSDESDDESSKKKKKASGKTVSNFETKKPKRKASSQREQGYEDDVSDSEVFGLKSDKNDCKEEENSEDDMWIGLNDKDSAISKNLRKSKQYHKCKDYDLQKPESSQKSVHHNSGSPRKELQGYKKGNLKPFHSTKYSRRKSFSGSNHPNIIKDDVEDKALSNTNLDTADNSVSGLVESETLVFYKSTDCDIQSIVSNSVSVALSEQESIEDSTSANIPGEKLVSGNQQVVDSFFVEDPVVEAVSSFAVEGHVIESVSSFAVEGPVIEAVSSFVVEGPVIEAVSSFAVEGPVIEAVSSFAVEGPVIEAVSSFSVEDPVIEAVSSFSVEGSLIEAFSVAGSVIEAVSSLAVDNPITDSISKEEMVAKKIQPVSLPLTAEVSSLNNEDLCNENFLDNAEVDLNLKEDFKSIERNWTQQIEEEMKQDSVVLKIESDNNYSINISGRQLLNVAGNKIISKELTDLKSINKSECKESENSEIVSSLQTLQVEQTQNNVLICEESETQSRSLGIDGKDFSIKGTTNLSLEGYALEKDNISHFDKPECVLPESEKKYEDDDLVVTAGNHTEIVVDENIVSYSKKLKSTKDVTNEASLGAFEVSAEALKKQSVIILKESDKDDQIKQKASFDDIEKKNNCDNSEVSLLNAEVDDQRTTEEDCHKIVSKDNNDIETPAIVLSTQESLTKHSDDSFKIAEEKNFSSEASPRNISSDNSVSGISSNIHQSVLCKLQENIISNKNEPLATEKNALFCVEKSNLPGSNLSEINLIRVEAETNNLYEIIGEYSNKSLVSASEKCDSLSSKQDDSHISLKVNKNDSIISVSMTSTSKSQILIEKKIFEHEEAQQNCILNVGTKKNESERVTDLTEIHENDYLKKDIDDEGKMLIISDTIISSQDEIVKPAGQVPQITAKFEFQTTKLSTTSEYGEEFVKAKTLGKMSAQPSEKDSGNCTEIGDINIVHNNNEISDQAPSNNFGTNSEVIYETLNDIVPSSYEEKLEDRKMKGFKQEDDHVRNRTDNKLLAASKVLKDNETVVNQFSNSLSSCDHSCRPNIAREENFEPPVEVINSANIVHGFEGVSKNILNENYNIDGENVSKINSIVCKSNAHEDEKVIDESISLSIEKDICPDREPLDCQLNNAKIDVYNDSLTSDALNPLKKETIYEVQNVTSAENDAKICSEKTSIEKSFFFGKEDIETYIRSTKATFQIGGRVSLPEEDEPIDPMEVAMIEDEEKILTQPSSTEPDIDLSLHLSPEHLRKPKKVDQGIVTDNSYLQRRARKLRKSVKKLLTDESCSKEIENKINVHSEDHRSNLLAVEKELKCISTQTSDGVLDEIDLSESDEELIDYTKISGPSQKSVELKKKITRKMRQSSEPPLTHKEDLKRKSSICPKKSDESYGVKEEPYRDKKHSQRLLQERDVKGILKNKDFIENFDEELKIQPKADYLPVRRSRRLSECVVETNELLKNQCEKDQCIKSQRRSRCYSEEPDFYRFSSYKDKESAGYNSSENEKEAAGKDNIPKQKRSRRHSEEPEMQAVLNKNLEKRKVQSASTNIDDEYTSRRRSKRFSEEPDISNKYLDERRRNSKNPDYSNYDFSNAKHSQEPELRGILKKSRKGSRKTSLSCEMINELKHNEVSDSRKESIKLRSQSEEPELQGIPKKRHRQSRRSSWTNETAADFYSQVEEIPEDGRKIHKHSDDTEIQGILKKRSSNKSRSRSSLLSEVASEMKICHKGDQSEENREFRKHSESEIQGILKKSRKECIISDNETIKLKHLGDDVLPKRNRRSRRHSEEPEMLKTLKKRERRGSQSSDIDNECNLHEGVRRIRRHSEEPEVRGILKKRSSISRKSLHITETASDLKLQLEDDLPYESSKSKEHSDESDVKGILKKSKISRRGNSNTGETDKGLLHLEKDSPEYKNRHLLDYDSHKAGKKRSNVSKKTDSINCAKTQEDYEIDEECLSTNKNSLKNQTCLYVSGTNNKNDEKSNSDDIVKMVTDADVEPNNESQHLYPRPQTEEKDARLDDEDMQKRSEGDNKEIDSLSSAELVSENKRSRFNLVSHEEERVKESPVKVRRRSSSTAIAKEETVNKISLPEIEIKNIRKSLRKTPDKKEVNAKIVEEKKRKVEPENLKFVPKRLDYPDDESPEKKKSRSLIDFPIKRNSRLPRPALEDIREEDEDLLKKKKKSLDDFHLEEMKKKAALKKPSVSKLVIGDSDVDSDVSTPELWKKELTKEKRLTRTQQKHFLMNQQLTSVSEIESPTASSSPRRNIRKKAEATDSPLKTPTRSSLRLQKKPPSETD